MKNTIWGKLKNDAYNESKIPREVEIELSEKNFSEIVFERIKKLGVPVAECKKCGELMFFVKTKTGKEMPTRFNLTSHFANCKFADSFRKKTK